MKIILNILLTCTFLIIAFSCENNIVDPPDDQPGRRDYVWTVDTLFNYAYMNKLWGSSHTDVWAIGQPGDFTKSIWHYDGTGWTTDNVFRLIIPHSIYGFSQNNVWMGGSGGKIWHYDGGSWKEIVKLTKDGLNDIVFDNMWGDTQNNLYAFGAYPDDRLLANNSVIAHYTTKQWSLLDTDGLVGIVERFYKNKTDGKFYLRTNRIGGGEFLDSNLIYEYNQEKYTKIYGSIWTKGHQADISLINGEVYFVLGNEIAKRVDNIFETFLTIENANFYQRIWGKNSKDIFLSMTDGLAHYNGSDIEYLFYFNKARTQIYNGVAIFDNEVFFLAKESSTGLYLIYHGTLKEGG